MFLHLERCIFLNVTRFPELRSFALEDLTILTDEVKFIWNYAIKILFFWLVLQKNTPQLYGINNYYICV